MKRIKFTDEHGSFVISQPENTSYLYFPLASETGLKSAVTPSLGGDAKIDQETFLLEPVSSENLHNNRSGVPRKPETSVPSPALLRNRKRQNSLPGRRKARCPQDLCGIH